MLTNQMLKISAVFSVLSMRTHQMICNRLSCTSPISTSLFRIVASAIYCPRASVDHSQHRQLCSSSSSRKLPVLTLYTKQQCPLCDEALHHLEPFLDQVVLEKVDITKSENRAWWKLYRYDIPVFHLDGRYLMKHKADLGIFKTALNDFHKNSLHMKIVLTNVSFDPRQESFSVTLYLYI